MMSVHRFPLLVLVLYSFINRTFGNGNCENKLVAFNTGLTKTIPKTEERKNELIRKLRDMDSDIVCLQEVERFGNVSCTHLTAGLGPIYSEPELQGMFSSWEKQNAYDAQFVIDYFKDGNTVVMGDLNTGPKIEDRGITAELGGSYDLLVANGYTSPYVTLVGKGTYNDENPFTSSGPHDKIIDHVLLKKGFKAVSAKRVLDEDYVLVGGPLSDHYGVEVSVVQDDDTGPDTPA